MRGLGSFGSVLISVAASLAAVVPTPPVYAALEAQTTALASAQSVAPTSGQKYAYDQFFKRIKAAGIVSAADITKHGIWVADQTAGTRLVNLLNPGVHDMVQQGTVTYTANTGFTSAASGNYYDSGIPLTAIDQNSHTLAVYTKTITSTSNYDLGTSNGAVAGGNASTVQGFGIMARDSNGAFRFRSAGVDTVGGAAASAIGKGFAAMVRRDASNVEVWGDDQLVATVASTSAAITTGTTTNNLAWGRTTGVLGVPGRQQGAAFFLPTLSATQMAVLANATRELMEHLEFGAVDFRTKLVSGNETLTFDTVVYGGNLAALTDAIQSKRGGLNVAIVLSHQEYTLGGVITGGLGATDITIPSGGAADFKNMLNGVSRDIITLANTYYNAEYGLSRSDTTAMMEPRIFSRAFRNICVANGIPVFFSDGIYSVATSGQKITSFTTFDGRTFAADTFTDASVTGDLISKSNLITYRTGREAAGTGAEAGSGYKGFLTTGGATSSQYQGTVIGWLNGTDASGGYVPTAKAAPATANGAATSDVQDFNFRIIVTNIANRRVPFFTAGSPPPGYSRAYYEGLDRQFVAKPTLTLQDIFITLPNLLAGSTSAGVFDWNNGNGIGFSTDAPESGTKFVAAQDEAGRDAVALDVFRKHVLGLFYYLGYDTTTNVPSAVRTSFLTYGWDKWHFPVAQGVSGVHQPNHIYVREMKRITGMLRWDGNDAALADTGTPRSGRIVSHAFYACDHHADQTIVNPTTGALWREGIANVAGTGGADGIAPIFLESFVPLVTQCTNLVTTNSPDMSVLGYGAYRMEFSMGMTGQAMGALKSIKKRKSLARIHDVAYSDIVSELAAAPDTTKIAYQQNNPALGALV